MAEIGKFMQEAAKAGVLVTTGGLPQTGTRVRLSGEKLTVTDGPFIEAKELIAGFAVIQVKSKVEAIEWAKGFRKIIGEGESEIVQIYGPE
jgi:hypothetical protein